MSAAQERLAEVRHRASRSSEALGEDSESVGTILSRANDCVSSLEDQLQPYASVIQSLETRSGGSSTSELVTKLGVDAAPPNDTAPDEGVSASPQVLAIRKEATRIEGELAACMLVARQAEQLLSELNAMQRSRLWLRVVTRGSSLVPAVREGGRLGLPADWGAAWPLDPTRSVADRGSTRAALASALAVVVAIGVGVWGRRRLRQRLQRCWPERPAARHRIAVELIERAPIVAALSVGAVAMATYPASDTPPVLMAFFLAVLVWVLARSLVQALTSYASDEIDEPHAPPPARWLHIVSALIIVGGAVEMAQLETLIPTSVYALGRFIFFTALLIVTLRLVPWASRALGLDGRLLVLLQVVLATGLIAEVVGFRSLVDYVVLGLSGSAVVLAAGWSASRLSHWTLDQLDEGRQAWSRRIREAVGVDQNASFPGTLWMRVVSAIAIWGAAALALLGIWGLSETGFAVVGRYLVEGFDVGTFRIVPWQILLAVSVFSLLLGAVHWLTEVMDKRWAARAGLDDGARHALVKITSYVAILIAGLICLSIAGLTFTNVTLIVGALSVGIGFGLQNIVNNFVSGVILLFERSIRTGDWVVVGDTEGYVKRIRVRATEIETFDRADVIVPNSELVSSQVTNWTLSDKYGRLVLDVSVAYGSDVDEVQGILREAVLANDSVLDEKSVRPPRVLFRGFADSALRFQIHAFIADINNRFRIESDLYSAVYARLSEAGITIPYPQRDLHVRSLPPAAERRSAEAIDTASSPEPVEAR